MKKWVLCTCAAFAAVSLIAAWRLIALYNAPSRAFATPAPAKTAAATPSPTLSPAERAARAEAALLAEADAGFMQGRVNVLLVGWDESPERSDPDSDAYRSGKNGFRSDVLMLAAIDFTENRVHLISIPRDTYTPLYAVKGRWKINAAFLKGGGAQGEGFAYARKTVEMLFGVPVDYHVGVNMEGIKKLIDAMGGVDYDVDVRIELNGRVLEKGLQHLDGQQALDYCRARKGISTDLGRNDRQQRLLLALFAQLQSQRRLSSVPALYAAVKDDVYTNLSPSQIAALAAFALKLDAETSVRRSTLAGEYVSNVYNASYYVLVNKKLAALVKEEFGVTLERSSRYDLATVKRDKAAAAAQDALESFAELSGSLALPALSDGLPPDGPADERTAAREDARTSGAQLALLLELDASEREIRRLHRFFLAAVGRVLRAYGADAAGYAAFASLNVG